MVIINEKIYKCPYCFNDYYDYDDATECASNCVDPLNVIETNGNYICEMCDNEYFELDKAEECEKEHINKDDKYYNKYKEKESFKKLERAANHPTQKKLLS